MRALGNVDLGNAYGRAFYDNHLVEGLKEQVRKLRTELADKVTELNALQKSTKATQAHNVLLRQGQLLCQVFPPGLSMEELVDMAKQRSVTAGAPEALNFLRNHLSKHASWHSLWFEYKKLAKSGM
ncbi:uncharacterized protein HaLaN_00512 [Haematococcus lacustris]|uniref:Uncharacterized protein n=1 Tax=Haematococcus lacustris TaxID=44745 RepID=A0A699Y6W1_HAELA|nr:uncharacterized protein HaLaN_00512 [Haematococcus lacustris]